MGRRWFGRRPVDSAPASGGRGTQRAKLFLEGIDEGVIDLGGGEYRGVLEVEPRNLDLASPEEREEIIAAFQAFLNGLTFPLQILVRIERLGAEDYLVLLTDRAREETSVRLRALAIAQLAFVRDLAAAQVLLHRRFFLVVPFTLPSAVERGRPGLFGRVRSAARSPHPSVLARRLVARRQAEVIRQLETVGLRARCLGTDEILALYYAILCPTLARLQPLRQSLAAATAPVVRSARAEGVGAAEARCLAG